MELLREAKVLQGVARVVELRSVAQERPEERVLLQAHCHRLGDQERVKEHTVAVARVAEPPVDGEPPLVPVERREPSLVGRPLPLL